MEKVTLDTWHKLVHDHYRAIYAFAFQFLGKREDAEDVTQEVFLKAGEKFNTLLDAEKVKPWLYQIARNACIDRTRWYKRILLGSDADPAPLEMNSDLLLGKTLLSAIQMLPRKQRAVFILRMLHDLSTDETARILSIQSGSVKSHLSRALLALQKNMNASFRELTTDIPASSSQVLEGEKPCLE